MWRGLHFSCIDGLKRVLVTIPNNIFNNNRVDRVPLYKSLNMQTWPILCMFDKMTPFIEAVFVGNSKPTNSHDFLYDFLAEYKQLSENGFEYEGQVLKFLKGIKSHNGYNGCERCIVEGVYVSSRKLFLDINCDLRVFSK